MGNRWVIGLRINGNRNGVGVSQAAFIDDAQSDGMYADIEADVGRGALGELLIVFQPDIGLNGAVRVAGGRAVEDNIFRAVAVVVGAGLVRAGMGGGALIFIDGYGYGVRTGQTAGIGDFQRYGMRVAIQGHGRINAIGDFTAAFVPFIADDVVFGVRGSRAVEGDGFGTVAVGINKRLVRSGIGRRGLVGGLVDGDRERVGVRAAVAVGDD